MKHLFFKFLVAFFITSAVVLSWSEYFFLCDADNGGSGISLSKTGVGEESRVARRNDLRYHNYFQSFIIALFSNLDCNEFRLIQYCNIWKVLHYCAIVLQKWAKQISKKSSAHTFHTIFTNCMFFHNFGFPAFWHFKGGIKFANLKFSLGLTVWPVLQPQPFKS